MVKLIDEKLPPVDLTTGSTPNPKHTAGSKKAPLSTVPSPVLMEVGVAMLEGAKKYGRHNFRDAGVHASTYYDASLRHLFVWWEGEDNDSESGLSHITKAIASLVVLRDAMMQNKFTDDRPPKSVPWLDGLNQQSEALFRMFHKEVEP